MSEDSLNEGGTMSLEEYWDKKAEEGEMYSEMLSNLEMSLAPTIKTVGENMVFIVGILMFPFYFFQFDYQFWLLHIDMSMLFVTAVSGLVLKFRAEQLLDGDNPSSAMADTATETAKDLLGGSEMAEDIDKEVEELIKETEEEK